MIKKMICGILLIACVITLTGCYNDLEETSLNDYIASINKYSVGFSDVEIDLPDFFLPNSTFIEDYDYIDGVFYWRADDSLRGLYTTNVRPEISLLALKYDENVYIEAKSFMLEKISPIDKELYAYNGYIFYQNPNFIKFWGEGRFPQFFTMASYNDEKHTLLFIGMYSWTFAGPSCLEDRFLNDPKGNWEEFIETYYGDIYDFSKS